MTELEFPRITSQALGHPVPLDTCHMFDTNVWIDLSRGNIRCSDFKRKAGSGLVLSPLTIIELVRGSVNGSEEQFVRDQRMFKCMFDTAQEIQELPKVFVYKILWNLDWGVSGVRPKHYRELLQMLISSETLAEFKRNAEATGSSWTKITQLYSVHEAVLDKELGSLARLAGGSLKALSIHVSRLFNCGGMIVDPVVIEKRFSAAMEFMRNSILKVRQGAKPWINDRGSYVDLQLFFYLADPRIFLVTKEDFSSDIKASPQRTRIISYDKFSHQRRAREEIHRP